MWKSLDQSFPAWLGGWILLAVCVAYWGAAKGLVLAAVLIIMFYFVYKVGQSTS